MSDYTLKFSNKFKEETITVPSMPPGINTVDTSLNLVGRGYPAYGEKIAENFLHLLENFSSPIPPENPIEGQLWYDTSNPRRKILRVMDGTASAARWPSVSGIYQQGNDPKLSPSAGLKSGDIWVDTTLNQLKIFNNNQWTTVGPLNSAGTGPQTEELTENTSQANKRRVTVHRVDGEIVLIISSGAEFVPNPSISGFSSIKPGINLTRNLVLNSQPYLLQGTADNSNKLGNVVSSNYVLKTVDQTINANYTFVVPNDGFGKGKYGILIKLRGATSGSPNDIEYAQFYKESTNAIIFNSEQTGAIQLKAGGADVAQLSVQKSLVSINTSTEINGSLDVDTTLSSKSINVQSTLTVNENVFVGKTLHISSTTTAAGVLYIGTATGTGPGIIPNNTSTYDIGSHAKPFRSVYAENVYALNSVYSLSYDYLPGSLRLFAGSTVTNTVPEGWMFCTGTSLSTSTYAELFNAIGYHYGGSAGTFFIPNLSVTSTQGAITTTTYYIIKT